MKMEFRKGEKYHIKRTNFTIVAFTIGKNVNLENGFKIYASHTDSPCFRINLIQFRN